jgi:hypothetical protein
MNATRRISVRPIRTEAVLIGNQKSVLSFVTKSPATGNHTSYDVVIDNGTLLEMMDALKRGQHFEKVTK